MFVESFIYVEEEKKSQLGELQESILVVKLVEDEGNCWYLTLENYRAYGFPLSILTTSTKILSHQSDTSIVDMPYALLENSIFLLFWSR